LGPPAVIVLDDYHEVAPEAPLHEVVREAAESLPSGLSLLVLSRNDPPAALARLRLHGELVRFGWEDLQLTLDEAHGIAALSAPQVQAVQSRIAELHGQTQGWVAGLVLLLERGENSARGAPAPHLDARSVLFDYFATEIFGRLVPSTRAPLLCTAFLRRITAGQAERLTGDNEVGRGLADLERRNCFVVQREEAEAIYAEPIYEVHPLFREFLLERAHAAFDEAALVALQRSAAELLDEAGEPEEAAPRYHAARDWQALSSLVLHHAPALVAQGRHRTLGQWLSGLPSALFEHAPWLRY
jgi:ATP/maltotriose-dependent transcriptional regulator MalT